MDVDFSHDPAVIPTMLRGCQRGSRCRDRIPVRSGWSDGGLAVLPPVPVEVGQPVHGVDARLTVRDCTSGFRAYRATALRAIEPASTTAEGYAFLTELVRSARQAVP